MNNEINVHSVYQYCLTFCNFLTKQDYFLATSNCTCTVTQFADNKVGHGLWNRMENTLTVMCDLLVKRVNSDHLYRALQSPKITAPKHCHSCIFQSQVRGNVERVFSYHFRQYSYHPTVISLFLLVST